MAKTIKVISISHKVVPDDYELPEAFNNGDIFVIECDGDSYMTIQQGPEFAFFNLTAELQNISPIREFLFWANIQWVNCWKDGDLPDEAYAFLEWFRDQKKKPTQAMINVLKERRLEMQRRATELSTQQVFFNRTWDKNIFPDEQQHKWFSVN